MPSKEFIPTTDPPRNIALDQGINVNQAGFHLHGSRDSLGFFSIAFSGEI